MNFVQQLMRAPIVTPVRKSHASKARLAYRDNAKRYRLYLENCERTIPEMTALLKQTYEGTRSTMMRMLERGEIIKTTEAIVTPNGRRPAGYTWNKDYQP